MDKINVLQSAIKRKWPRALIGWIGDAALVSSATQPGICYVCTLSKRGKLIWRHAKLEDLIL